MPAFVLRALLRVCRLFPLLLCLLAADARATLPAPLTEALRRQHISEEAVGLWVQALGSVTPEVAHQPDRPMNPASVMKLVTTFAAFDALGPNHTWKTRLFADGEPGEGVLPGNLYLVGEGDPAFTIERLWRLLRGLRSQGVREIRGDIVLDRSAWTLPPHDPAAFDGRGHRPYNTGPDALLVNFASLRLSFLPSPRGGLPRVIPDPPLEGVSLVSALRPGKGACGDWDERLELELLRPEGRSVLRVAGEWRDSCGARDWYVVPFATEAYARAAVAALWKDLGGSLRGAVRDGVTPAEARPLGADVSPSLAEVARDMNKWSNNVQARHLLASLGAQAGSQPDTIAAGARAVSERISAAGIDAAGLVVDNGSGLSRAERVTARQLGQMLDIAFARPWMPEFVASFAVAGVDGTARHRLADSPARGFAHVKTGSINGARAIAGYVLDRYGRRHAMALLVNDANAGASREAQDALLEWVWAGAGRADAAAE